MRVSSPARCSVFRTLRNTLCRNGSAIKDAPFFRPSFVSPLRWKFARKKACSHACTCTYVYVRIPVSQRAFLRAGVLPSTWPGVEISPFSRNESQIRFLQLFIPQPAGSWKKQAGREKAEDKIFYASLRVLYGRTRFPRFRGTFKRA